MTWYFRHLKNVVDQSTLGWVDARRTYQPKDRFPWDSLTFIEDYHYVRFYLRLLGSLQKKPTVTLDAPIDALTRSWTSTLFWEHKTFNGSDWPRGKIATTNAPNIGFDTQRRPFSLGIFYTFRCPEAPSLPLFSLTSATENTELISTKLLKIFSSKHKLPIPRNFSSYSRRSFNTYF